jgi:hypothetical protein
MQQYDGLSGARRRDVSHRSPAGPSSTRIRSTSGSISTDRSASTSMTAPSGIGTAPAVRRSPPGNKARAVQFSRPGGEALVGLATQRRTPRGIAGPALLEQRFEEVILVEHRKMYARCYVSRHG